MWEIDGIGRQHSLRNCGAIARRGSSPLSPSNLQILKNFVIIYIEVEGRRERGVMVARQFWELEEEFDSRAFGNILEQSHKHFKRRRVNEILLRCNTGLI